MYPSSLSIVPILLQAEKRAPWNDIEEFFFVYDEPFNLTCSLAVSQIHETLKLVRMLDLQTPSQGPFQLDEVNQAIKVLLEGRDSLDNSLLLNGLGDIIKNHRLRMLSLNCFMAWSESYGRKMPETGPGPSVAAVASVFFVKPPTDQQARLGRPVGKAVRVRPGIDLRQAGKENGKCTQPHGVPAYPPFSLPTIGITVIEHMWPTCVNWPARNSTSLAIRHGDIGCGDRGARRWGTSHGCIDGDPSVGGGALKGMLGGGGKDSDAELGGGKPDNYHDNSELAGRDAGRQGIAI
ncbi:hypothetical protein BJV78DRAFT_1157978 [Lactifluus subvellereus]|nr:hypothetical protein BJV78DRAFT_1157978 [Lactifluus subvellereus]